MKSPQKTEKVRERHIQLDEPPPNQPLRKPSSPLRPSRLTDELAGAEIKCICNIGQVDVQIHLSNRLVDVRRGGGIHLSDFTSLGPSAAIGGAVAGQSKLGDITHLLEEGGSSRLITLRPGDAGPRGHESARTGPTHNLGIRGSDTEQDGQTETDGASGSVHKPLKYPFYPNLSRLAKQIFGVHFSPESAHQSIFLIRGLGIHIVFIHRREEGRCFTR